MFSWTGKPDKDLYFSPRANIKSWWNISGILKKLEIRAKSCHHLFSMWDINIVKDKKKLFIIQKWLTIYSIRRMNESVPKSYQIKKITWSPRSIHLFFFNSTQQQRHEISNNITHKHKQDLKITEEHKGCF